MTRRASAATIATIVTILVAAPACAPSSNEQPLCGHRSPLTLMAESVRSASLVPCVASLPVGWSFGGFTVDERHSVFGLEGGTAEGGVADITLTRSCLTSGLRRVASSRADIDEYESTPADGRSATRLFLFEGGCVRLKIVTSSAGSSRAETVVTDALDFVPSDSLGPSPGA
jgi:hypothetical protein